MICMSILYFWDIILIHTEITVSHYYSVRFNLCVKNLSHVEGTAADTIELPLCDRTNAATA